MKSADWDVENDCFQLAVPGELAVATRECVSFAAGEEGPKRDEAVEHENNYGRGCYSRWPQESLVQTHASVFPNFHYHAVA